MLLEKCCPKECTTFLWHSSYEPTPDSESLLYVETKTQICRQKALPFTSWQLVVDQAKAKRHGTNPNLSGQIWSLSHNLLQSLNQQKAGVSSFSEIPFEHLQLAATYKNLNWFLNWYAQHQPFHWIYDWQKYPSLLYAFSSTLVTYCVLMSSDA